MAELTGARTAGDESSGRKSNLEQHSYCAFISYRHLSPDQEIAKALHTAIETYRIPAGVRKQTGRKHMGMVFRDQEELPLSSNLSRANGSSRSVHRAIWKANGVSRNSSILSNTRVLNVY